MKFKISEKNGMGIFGISIISHIVDRMQYRKTKVE
jgi:hypothetical protein